MFGQFALYKPLYYDMSWLMIEVFESVVARDYRRISQVNFHMLGHL